MSLFDILACPNCKVGVIRDTDGLRCPQCRQVYPIVGNVPVMFPDASVPDVQHEAELHTRASYDPWVHRVILQSLLDDQVVLDVGSGNMSLDDPNIIRMDVRLSPHVDLVADLHALPFLPSSVDYIFSCAVFEHLRNPFEAAQSIYQTLKDGGYVYNECNFVYPYHGYPHHYFNATLQGMEQLFARFVHLRKGVATYQMPSFTLDAVLRLYLGHSRCRDYPHGRRMASLIDQILALNSPAFDIYFTEPEALYVAAGVYLSGLKQETPESTLIPAPIRQVWEKDETLRLRFPRLNDLSTVNNIMHWAQVEGRESHPSIAQHLEGLQPFSKHGDGAPRDRTVVRSFPFDESHYGAIGFDPTQSLEVNAQIAEARLQSQTSDTAPGVEDVTRRAREEVTSAAEIDRDPPGVVRRALWTFRHEGLTCVLFKAAQRLGEILSNARAE